MEQTNTTLLKKGTLPTNWEGLVFGVLSEATCQITNNVGDVPNKAMIAILSISPVQTGIKLDEGQVDWCITVFDDLGVRLVQPVHKEGGSKSNKNHCGELCLWGSVKSKSTEKQDTANAHELFSYRNAIYVIDAGLCPCLKCCSSLIGLAKRCESTIVVRPIKDYELIMAGEKAVSHPQENAYLLIFQPDADDFLLYYQHPADTPVNYQTLHKEVAVGGPCQALAKCSRSQNHTFIFEFRTNVDCSTAITTAKVSKGASTELLVRCPKCTGKNIGHLKFEKQAQMGIADYKQVKAGNPTDFEQVKKG